MSCFANCWETEPIDAWSVAKLAARIRNPSPDVVAIIEDVRRVFADPVLSYKQKKATASSLKKGLSTVTMAGMFSHRSNEGIIYHSGLISIDIDGLTPAQAIELRDRLGADLHVAIVFLSPSATGVKGAVRFEVEGKGNNHAKAFLCIARYINERYKVKLDEGCKDVSRLCFLSHDAGCIHNPDAVPLDLEQWPPLTKEEAAAQRIAELVEGAHFAGLSCPLPNEIPILQNSRGVMLGEPGNLATIEGQQKSGKTGVVSALISTFIGADEKNALGLISPRASGWVLHFDCEQGPRNHHRLMTTIARRAGLNEIPETLHSFSLLRADIADRWKMVEFVAESMPENIPIRCVVFDGGADFISRLNDEESAFELVDRQFKFAIKHDCLVVIVVHENPGTESGKTRGHYGSQLQRKAQSCLVVEKGSDGISALYGKHLRDGDWPKAEAVHFCYDGGKRMHVMCEDPTGTRAEKKADRAREKLAQLAQATVLGATNYAELVLLVCKERRVKDRQAKRLIADMEKAELIKKNENGLFILS